LNTGKPTRYRRTLGHHDPRIRVRVTKAGRKTFVVMTRVLIAGQWKI
jgi:hypothetical protein